MAVVAASAVVLFVSAPAGEEDQIALTSPSPQIPTFDISQLPTEPSGPTQEPTQPPSTTSPAPAHVGMTAETGPAAYALIALAATMVVGTAGLARITKH